MNPIRTHSRQSHGGGHWRDGEPPWPRNNEFVDRDRELEQLWQTLRPQHGPRKECWISGVAGIGKTQLALEYNYRFGTKYSQCIWLQNSNVSSSPPIQSERGIQLIIMDLADGSIHSEQWQKILRNLPLHNASVLIAARPPVDDAQVELDGIPEDDAIRWLKEALPANAQGWYNDSIQTLCKTVRCLPFPLAVIRRVIGRSVRSPAEVLDRVQALGAKSWLAHEIERDPSLSYCPMESLPIALEVLQ